MYKKLVQSSLWERKKKDFPFLHFPLLQLNLSLHPNHWEFFRVKEWVGMSWFTMTGQVPRVDRGIEMKKFFFAFLRASFLPLTSTVGTEKVVLLSQFHFINSIWLINEINHCVNSKM